MDKEEILDKVRHREEFQLIIKLKNRKPERFPGTSIEEDEERIEQIISEIKKSGADVHIRQPANPSRIFRA